MSKCHRGMTFNKFRIVTGGLHNKLTNNLSVTLKRLAYCFYVILVNRKSEDEWAPETGIIFGGGSNNGKTADRWKTVVKSM